MRRLVGMHVVIISDNECYKDYKGAILKITHVATNRSQHPGYDESMRGEALYDLVDLEGKAVPFSLYEYEVKGIL
jgi:hypothetical protein